MARINLLPWRKELRERNNRDFNILMAAVAGLAALLVLGVFTFFNNELSNQQAANDRIDQENKQLDVALKSIETLEAQREQMLSQMKVIQDLQGRRSIPVRVWYDLAQAVPKDVYLLNIKRVGEVITITGKADNANEVARLVRNIDGSEWLGESAVLNIKSKIEAYQKVEAKVAKDPDYVPVPEEGYVEFVITTKIQTPKPEEEGANNSSEPSPDATVATTTNDDLAAPVHVEPVGGTPAPEVAPANPVPEAPANPVPEAPANPVPAAQAQPSPETTNAKTGA
ncbi:PilN domain-containing protein [Moraxella oblonga]|uniref:PilN domain-containing protein n=1 Tax=Moraxella oblonga TaxID=200413 RepID=UPI000A04B007|nr:PilN domain-containing protein [Moraxella oblonga]